MQSIFLPMLSNSFALYGSKFTPPCTITLKLGNSSPTFFPLRFINSSKYICIHGGIPLMSVISCLIVSSTILFNFVSQSSIQLFHKKAFDSIANISAHDDSLSHLTFRLEYHP